MNRLSDIDAPDIETSDAVDAQAASWFARNRNATARADRKAFAAWQACRPMPKPMPNSNNCGPTSPSCSN